MSATDSIDTVSQTQEVTLELETVLAALKQLGCADLFKVMRTATTEAEKRSKTEAKAPKKPKGTTPVQLQKPKAWVQFVLKWATENGWDEFTCVNKKSGEEILMPASIHGAEGYTFPDGKKLILTQAMSLSKQLWQAKAKTGTNEELYRQFEAEFVTMPVEEVAAPAAKAPLVRKTAEEKAQELAEKKAKREKEAAEKKAANAAAREEKKAATAAANAAAKEAAKVAKAAATPAKVVVPKAATKVVAKAPAKAVAAVAAPVGVKPKKPAAPKPVEWTCPADGNVYPWDFNGQKYLRNSENQVWVAEADGSCGDWAGLYMPEGNIIDDSVADPYADDE